MASGWAEPRRYVLNNLMPVSPARWAAYQILLRVHREDAFASELLHSSGYQKLSAADHRLTTELVMGVLRWQSLLDEEIAKYASLKISRIDPEVLTALRLASYQFKFLSRIPTRAAIHESVELVKQARKRSAVAFANAVLRKMACSKVDRAKLESCASTTDLAKFIAHPPWLLERWVREFGFEITQKICIYDQQIPNTTIAIRRPAMIQELEEYGIKLSPGHFLVDSQQLVTGDLQTLPVNLRKEIAIQDEGSQLVAHLLRAGSIIFDCCAAPGGKTRVLAEENPDALVIAADFHPHRARLLCSLVTTPNVHVIAADARKLPFNMTLDAMLVDVPCSGTGTLARNPEIKWRLKPDGLAELQKLQVAILQSAMQHLTPGGMLVYSTCSLEKEENEDVVQKVLASEHSFRLIDCRDRLQQLQHEGELTWEDLESLTKGPYLRTVPGVHPCDGFFAAIIKRI